MDKLKDLLAGRAAAIEAADSLTEISDRDLTAEEEAEFDRLAGEIKALDAKIARASVVANARASTPIVIGGQAPLVDPGSPAAAGPQPKTEFENVGEYFAAIRFNPSDQRLASLWGEGIGAATTQSTTDARGGYAIPPQFIDTLLSVASTGGVVRSSSPMVLPSSPGAPDEPVTMPALDQSDHGESPTVPKTRGGVDLTWISEGAEKPQTDFKLRLITVTPYEVAGSLDITDKLLRNWGAAGNVITRLFSEARIAAEDSAFLSGNGSGKPTGVIGHAATLSIGRTAAGSFTYTDAVNMITSMLMRGGSPVWVMNQSVMPKLLLMQDPDGNYIWQPNAREGVPSTLLGYPIKWSERSPILGTAGDVLLADFSNYLIKDGSGPFIGASEHVRWRENITVFKTFWNVGGTPWLTAPFMTEDGLTRSPFVTLAA